MSEFADAVARIRDAARGSRRPCPECGRYGAITLTTGLVTRPVGSFSLAGAQAKVSAVEVLMVECDGCGWRRPARIVGGYVEVVDW